MDLHEHVTTVLKDFGYSYSTHNNNTDFRFHECTSAGIHWRSQIVVSPPAIELFVYLTDQEYLAKLQPWVLESVCHLNNCVSVLGYYDFSWTGSVRYRTFIDVRGQQDINSAVENMLNSVAFPLRMWSYCFERRGKAKPSDVVNAARIFYGTGAKLVSNETRRVFMQLVK